jgi:hypothetical protein
MKRAFLVVLLCLNLGVLVSAGGCGSSENRVIEQGTQPLSEEFKAEESAAVNQSSAN